MGWLWPTGLFFSNSTGVAEGSAAPGGSEGPEINTCWALLEVRLAVEYPGRVSVGDGGSAVSPPCTCSSMVCLEERIEVWSLDSGGAWGRGTHSWT